MGQTCSSSWAATASPDDSRSPPHRKIEPTFPGMFKQIRPDSGEADHASHFLVWETIPAHRDRQASHPFPIPPRYASSAFPVEHVAH